MMNRRHILSLLGGAAALPLVAGASAAQEGKTVVYYLKNVTNPFWKNVREGAERAAKDNKVGIQIAAPTKPDNIEEQIRLVEDWIVKKPDGMVFVPVDYKAMVPAVQKIQEAKIPVTIYNNKMTDIKGAPFVGLDDEEIGYQATKNVIKAMGGKGNLVHIDGVPGAITAQDRKKGMERALKEHPEVKLVASQPGNYRRLPAVQVFENLMQRFPQIDGVFAANDDMAVGVVEAASSAGRPVKVVGVDCIPDALAAIKDGRMLGSMDTQPHAQGYISMRAMVEQLKGAKVPSAIMLPLSFVDKSNVDAMLTPPGQRPAPDWDKVVAAQKAG